MTPLPIIIDTDIGDDIDDSLAITAALHSPELEVRGMTTVFRDAERRTLLARELLCLLGRSDVPIAAGYSRPLLQPWTALSNDGRPGEQLGRQFEALHPGLTPDPTVHAVEFLHEHIVSAHNRGEKLTVVAIGALTNVAMLLYRFPEVAPLCRVVVMGGCFLEPRVLTAWPEWNMHCDPEAAAITLRTLTETPGADLSYVGLDVTLQCVLDDNEVQTFHTSDKPYARFLGRLINLWEHPVTLHDPLTILSLFDDCVSFDWKRVHIPTQGENRGKTLICDGEPNCRVAVCVDAERAKALFMQRMNC